MPRALLLRSLPACVALTLGACASSRAASVAPAPRSQVPALTAPEAVVLPSDWATCPPREFERMAFELLPADVARPLSDASRAALAAALAPQDAASARASVLLARSLEPGAKEVLLARLEEREEGPDRESDAGDVVAAAGLGAFQLGEPDLDRLAALVAGERPHPDVEVRVEIARVALARGREVVIPFLLRVMREGTRSGLDQPIDWKRHETMAWAKSRAAEALAAHLGEPVTFDPDGSIEAQERELERLSARLGVVPR